MKTSISKDTIALNRDTARKLEAEARALRYKVREDRENIKAEEEAILQNMVDTLSAASGPMTAREISAAIDESMSVHEVAGQLTWASTSEDAGRRAPYRMHHMAHQTMADIAPQVRVEEQQITHHFAEVSEDGKVIPGGRTFKQTEKRNIYAIAR